MFTVRRSAERGHFDHGWLDTYHTFSFGEYHDPRHERFRSLRVMNEDRVAPGGGFPPHGHRDMEIITVVLSGALEHRDSLGSGDVIRPDDVQHMTAGSGIRHSEFNASREEPVHLYQIWLLPEARSLPPGYAQRNFPREGRSGKWQAVASPDGRENSLVIRQHAVLHRAALAAGQELEYSLATERSAWLQVLTGEVELNGHSLTAGDGAAVSEENQLSVKAVEEAELLLFDLA